MDCSCDSIHVNSNGTGFGKAMRKGYHWIPSIYLNLDNAGVHGTDIAVKNTLKDVIGRFQYSHYSSNTKAVLY